MKMELIVGKNKTLAFDRFFNQLKFQNIYPEQLRGFDIPQNLINATETLKNAASEDFTQKQRRIYRDVGRIFDRLWRKHEKDLNRITQWLAVYKPELTHAAKIIATTTKISWPYARVFIFPGIRNWGGSFENQVCIGIKPRNAVVPPDAQHLWYGTFTLIIHELIHVNTSKTEVKNLKYARDADEIATTFLTREVTRRYNARFHTHIPNAKLARPFFHLEKYERKFEKFLGKSMSYRMLVKALDSFLATHQHEAHYRT